jgi:hypothetical protein
MRSFISKLFFLVLLVQYSQTLFLRTKTNPADQALLNTFQQNRFQAFAQQDLSDRCASGNTDWGTTTTSDDPAAYRTGEEVRVSCGMVGGKAQYCVNYALPHCVPAAQGETEGTCVASLAETSPLELTMYSWKGLSLQGPQTDEHKCFCHFHKVTTLSNQVAATCAATFTSNKTGEYHVTVNHCPESLPFCVNATGSDTYLCESAAPTTADEEVTARSYNSASFCKHGPVQTFKLFSKHDLDDIAGWRSRNAKKCLKQEADCKSANGNNKSVNWYYSDDRCGKITGIDVHCVAYGENKGQYCVPDKAGESCDTSACRCKDLSGGNDSNKFSASTVGGDVTDANCAFKPEKTECVATHGIIKQWEQYIDLVRKGREQLTEAEIRANRVNCVFVRTVVEHPKPPKPPTPCTDATEMADSLIDSAQIMWVEAPENTNHVTFLEQAAEIASNAICAHTPAWNFQHGTTTVENFGLTSALVTLQCTGKAVETATCNALGDQMTGMLNHVLMSVSKNWVDPKADEPKTCFMHTGIWPAGVTYDTDADFNRADLAANSWTTLLPQGDTVDTVARSAWVDAGVTSIGAYLVAAKEVAQQGNHYFAGTVQLPYTKSSKYLLNDPTFCEKRFDLEASLRGWVYDSAMNYNIIHDFLTDCNADATVCADCQPDKFTETDCKINLESWMEGSVDFPWWSSPKFTLAGNAQEEVCMYMRRRTRKCWDNSGIVQYKSTNDPTAWREDERSLYNLLTCESLPEDDTVSLEYALGSKQHCKTVGWENAKEGAFKTYLRQLTDFSKSQVTVSVNDLLSNPEVLRIRNTALSAYCRHFSGKIFEHLKSTSESGDQSTGFKMSQFTNFADKCQAQCIHHAGKSPLSDPYLSQSTKGTDMDVLLPTADLFTAVDRNSQKFVDYDDIAQEMNHWKKNPNHRPLNVITRMGITLNKYLKNLQKKTMVWSIDTVIDSSTPKAFRDLADKHNFNYPWYRYNRGAQGVQETCNKEDHAKCQCKVLPADPCGANEGACRRAYYLNEIVPHQICLMRKILEEWQRAFLWKMTKWFHDHPTADEDSRVPVMMRRELGEKYCKHYCKSFPLSREIYTEIEEDSWRANECNQQCMIEFPRCSNLPSCLVSRSGEQLFYDDYEVLTKISREMHDLSIQNEDCSNDLVIYKKCDLIRNDEQYWVDNFSDLERAGQRREQRLMVVEMKTEEWRSTCGDFLETHGFSKTTCGPFTTGGIARDQICSDSVNRFCNGTECQAASGTDFQAKWSIDTFTQEGSELQTCAYIDRKFTNEDFLEQVRRRFLRSAESWPQEHWTVHANNQITFITAEEAYSMLGGVLSVDDTNWGSEKERHGLNNVYNSWEFTVDSQGDLRINKNPSCTFATECEVDSTMFNLMKDQKCYAADAKIVLGDERLDHAAYKERIGACHTGPMIKIKD